MNEQRTKAAAEPPLDCRVMRLFPKIFERLRRLDELKTKCEKIAEKWRAMRLTNFGKTGTELELMYYVLALEFHREKYWWMRSLPALPHNGGGQRSDD